MIVPRRFSTGVAAITAAALFGAAGSAAAAAETTSFSFTGSEQTFTVPAGVSTVHVAAIGGRGNAGTDGSDGGHRGTASGDLAVSPGETLFVLVGGAGAPGNTLIGLPGAGGFNGGARGASAGGGNFGGGGGGATDIRTISSSQPGSLGSRLIVAAGGGGGPAGSTGLPGGAGGGFAGVDGSYTSTCDPSLLDGGGKGGTQAAGGAAAGPGTQPGTFGIGGRGGGNGGGGGGGGYYGGGGGYTCGGGGGGSGYLGPRVSGGVFGTSSNDGDGTIDGSVVLTYTPDDPDSPVDPAEPGGDPEQPKTRLDGHPQRVVKAKGKARVAFRFSADVPDADFHCSLDGSRPQPCESPQDYSVGRGKHEFEVAATADGEADESPASFRFSVKRKR